MTDDKPKLKWFAVRDVDPDTFTPKLVVGVEVNLEVSTEEQLNAGKNQTNEEFVDEVTGFFKESFTKHIRDHIIKSKLNKI